MNAAQTVVRNPKIIRPKPITGPKVVHITPITMWLWGTRVTVMPRPRH